MREHNFADFPDAYDAGDPDAARMVGEGSPVSVHYLGAEATGGAAQVIPVRERDVHIVDPVLAMGDEGPVLS